MALPGSAGRGMDAAASGSASDQGLTDRLRRAAAGADAPQVADLLAQGADASYQVPCLPAAGRHQARAPHAGVQDEATGRNALMLAAAAGSEPVVCQLLEAGVPWNAVDRQGDCAGDHAAAGGHSPAYEAIVAAGARQPSAGPLRAHARAEQRGRVQG